jgi:hypothetical protein
MIKMGRVFTLKELGKILNPENKGSDDEEEDAGESDIEEDAPENVKRSLKQSSTSTSASFARRAGSALQQDPSQDSKRHSSPT